MRIFVTAALIISLLPLGETAKGAIVLVSEFRNVAVFASVNTTEGSDVVSTSAQSAGDFSSFDESTEGVATFLNGLAEGTAQQRSLISTASISASGVVTGDGEVTFFDPTLATTANTDAETRLSVGFEVATPQLFELSGMVSSLSSTGFPLNNANVSLSNQEGSFNLSFSAEFGENTPFEISGTLLPDTYFLAAGARVTATTNFNEPTVSGTADFSLDFQVTPVPIPASILLFAFGLLGLGGIARRKKVA